MDYQTEAMIFCALAGCAYAFLFFWSKNSIDGLKVETNVRGETFSAFAAKFQRERGFPFLFLSLILPIVLGVSASSSLPGKMHDQIVNVASAIKSSSGPAPTQEETKAPVAQESARLTMNSVQNETTRYYVNSSLEMVEVILVTLITLELAYWSGANSQKCVHLLQAAFYLDLSVLILLLGKLGAAGNTDACSLLQLPLIGVVGVFSILASYRCIRTAALWDRFEYAR